MPLDDVLRAIIGRVRAVMGQQCEAYVYLVEHERLVARAADGATAKYLGLALARGEGVAGRVWETGKTLVVDDYETWAGRSTKIESGDVRAIVGIPLHGSEGVAGVMGVYLTQPGRRFTLEEVRALEAYAQMAALALDHARLTQAFQVTETRFRLAFENSPTGRGLAGPDGRWILVNATLCALAGRTQEEMLRLRNMDIIHPDDREPTVDGMRALLEGESNVFDAEKRYLHPGGTFVWVRTVISLVRDSDGNPLYFIGEAVDISARKSAEEAMRQQTLTRALVRKMLRDLSHQARLDDSVMRSLGRHLAQGVRGTTLAEYTQAFATMGLGSLSFLARENGRFVFEGDDLLERGHLTAQPTCHLALGFLEGAVGAIAGAPALGAELRCQSQGHKTCQLVVKDPKP